MNISKAGIYIKKIAVCLPSYNEKSNIKYITQSVDIALSQLKNKYDCVIVNCDNNSPDKTNLIFNSCKTITKKESIVDKKIGKGVNIINFFKYCEKNNIDYAFMFDSDLKSFEPQWIYCMLIELENDIDFVLPLYKRHRYEGNSTNHFVVPILYAMYGQIIRQPIGGDYAFNKKYIHLFNQQVLPLEIENYGIDIYMVILALNKYLSFSQVELGYKVHNPSYYKMQNIFIEVAKGMKCALSVFNQEPKQNYQEIDVDFLSISDNNDFKFYQDAYEKYMEILLSVCENNISIVWQRLLINYLVHINKISERDIYEMSRVFIKYVFTYWNSFKTSTALESEKAIKDFSKKLREQYLHEMEE